MKDKDSIRLIAEILEGLQVPCSLGQGLLGTARKPYVDLVDKINIFGWKKANDYEVALRKILEEKK